MEKKFRQAVYDGNLERVRELVKTKAFDIDTAEAKGVRVNVCNMLVPIIP